MDRRPAKPRSDLTQYSRDIERFEGSKASLAQSPNAAEFMQTSLEKPNLAPTVAVPVPNMENPTGQITDTVIVKLLPEYVEFAYKPGTDPMHRKFVEAIKRLQGGY